MSANAGVAQRSHTTPRARTRVSWQDHAACVGADPDLFSTRRLFPQALLICAPCPVKAQCRELGVDAGDGVWGGVIQKGKASISVTDYLREGCGSEAGYYRHLAANEDACPACLEAHAREEARRAS